MRTVSDPFEVVLSDLVPMIGNPRTLDDAGRDRLARSLGHFGLYKPLLVWRDPDLDRLVILAGNQRAEVLRSLGVDRIEVVEFDGPRSEARAVALRDNNEDGQWAWDDLSRYLGDLDSLSGGEIDWTLTGFDAETVEDLLALATVDPRAVAPDPEPDPVDPETDPTSDSGSGSDSGYVESRFVNATIGNLKGRISLDLYARFTRVWSALSEEAGTTDVGALVDRLVERLGG